MPNDYSNLVNTKENLETAAKEALWCYHKTHKNQSFATADCESEIIREVFGQTNFQCKRTKCSAIAAGVFAPQIVKEMKNELASANFVSLATDASNHVATKMFPVVARWFKPLEGIQTKVLDLSSESGL